MRERGKKRGYNIRDRFPACSGVCAYCARLTGPGVSRLEKGAARHSGQYIAKQPRASKRETARETRRPERWLCIKDGYGGGHRASAGRKHGICIQRGNVLRLRRRNAEMRLKAGESRRNLFCIPSQFPRILAQFPNIAL